MKRPREQFQRLIEQAEHQLDVTDSLLGSSYWSDACFNAEQTAQMALKAFLYGKGERFIPMHTIQELAQRCQEMDGAFTQAIDWGRVLDRYHIPTRYPDALAPPAVPFKFLR